MREQNPTGYRRFCSNLINIPLLAPSTTYSTTNTETIKSSNANSSNLKTGHLNVRSLRNIAHLLEVKELSKFHKINVLTISETCLNSTLTNSEIGGVINSGISDHFPVYVILDVKNTKLPLKYITTRNYKYYDPLNVFYDLAAKSDDLLSILRGRDVNTQLETLKNALHSTLDSYASAKTFKVRSRSNTYISHEIKKHLGSSANAGQKRLEGIQRILKQH